MMLNVHTFLFSVLLYYVPPSSEQSLGCSNHSLHRYPSDCAKFIQIGSTGAIKLHCPEGLHFNPELNICDWPHQAGCLQNIETRKHSNVLLSRYEVQESKSDLRINPTDCSTYIQLGPCGETKMQCPRGLSFNPEHNICDWTRNVPGCNYEDEYDSATKEEGHDTPDNQAMTCIEKRIFQHPNQCRKFIICAPYGPQETECPNGSYFNPDTKLCDESYECSPPHHQPPDIEPDVYQYVDDSPNVKFFHTSRPNKKSPVSNRVKPSRIRPIASMAYKILYPNPCNATGYYAHPLQCRKFIMCTERRALVMICPPGLHFNPQNQSCDLPYYSSCDRNSASVIHRPFDRNPHINLPVHPLRPMNLLPSHHLEDELPLQELPIIDPPNSAGTTTEFPFTDQQDFAGTTEKHTAPVIIGYLPVTNTSDKSVSFVPVYEYEEAVDLIPVNHSPGIFQYNISPLLQDEKNEKSFTSKHVIQEVIDENEDSISTDILEAADSVLHQGGRQYSTKPHPGDKNTNLSEVILILDLLRENIGTNLTRTNKESTQSPDTIIFDLPMEHSPITFTGGYLLSSVPDTNASRPSISTNSSGENQIPSGDNMIFELPKDDMTVTFTGGYLLSSLPDNYVYQSNLTNASNTPEDNIVYDLPKEDLIVLFTGSNLLGSLPNKNASQPMNLTYSSEENIKPVEESMVYELPKEDVAISFAGGYLLSPMSDKNTSETLNSANPSEENSKPADGDMIPDLLNEDMTTTFTGGHLVPNKNLSDAAEGLLFKLPKGKLNVTLNGWFVLSFDLKNESSSEKYEHNSNLSSETETHISERDISTFMDSKPFPFHYDEASLVNLHTTHEESVVQQPSNLAFHYGGIIQPKPTTESAPIDLNHAGSPVIEDIDEVSENQVQEYENEAHEDKPSSSFGCSGRSSIQLLPLPENCTKYIVCVDGKEEIKDCPKGTFYTPKNQKCTDDNSYCVSDLLVKDYAKIPSIFYSKI